MVNKILQLVKFAKKLKKGCRWTSSFFGPHEENTEVLAPINETLNGK